MGLSIGIVSYNQYIYAVWDSLNQPATGTTLSNGNLLVTYDGTDIGQYGCGYATKGQSSGLYYAELKFTGGGDLFFGLAETGLATNNYLGFDKHGWSVQASNGRTNHNSTQVAYAGANAFGVDNRLMIAFDASHGRVWFGSEGTWFNGGDPILVTRPAFSGLAAGRKYIAWGGDASSVTRCLLITDPTQWAFTAPTGYGAFQ